MIVHAHKKSNINTVLELNMVLSSLVPRPKDEEETDFRPGNGARS